MNTLSKKLWPVLALTTPLTCSLILAPSAYAASQDECAIWLCLPTGFTKGCSGAKNAFLKRVKRFKPPLPSFTSCLTSAPTSSAGSDSFTSDYGVAAYIPSYRVCTRYEHMVRDRQTCVSWRTVPERYIKKRACHHNNKQGTSTPTNCTKTVRYTEVYRNGVLLGEPHYY